MNRETIITHLQIIHTWAEFARDRDLQFFTAKHLEDIAQWADDATALLKEQELKPIEYRACSDAMLKMWMENGLTDGEYNKIMDKLNKAHKEGRI